MQSDPMASPILKQLLHPKNAEPVTLRSGKVVGTYRRVVEFGGPNKDEHEIEAWGR